MRSAISLLMMVVMVLAPCAVAHAASVASHDAAPHQLEASLGSAEAHGHRHARPTEPHHKHTFCASDDPGSSHEACSANCDTLQRAANTSTSERSTSDIKPELAVFIGALSYVVISLNDDLGLNKLLRPVESPSDSKTVLRTTARLRL